MRPALTAQDWRARAGEWRRAQNMAEALDAIARAHALAPENGEIAFLHAQLRYEVGLPAAGHFARAIALAPDNREARRNHALALAAEGQAAAGEAALAAAVAADPLWLDGQRVLASLRWIGGDATHFDAGYAEATRRQPGHAGLWLGWFSAVAQIRDWPRASAILDAAEAQLGETQALLAARIFVAGESGARAQCAALLARAPPGDPFVALARIRHHMRAQDAAAALAVALPLTGTPLAGQVWPYIATCWRLLGDPRAAWLDGDPLYVREMDVALSPKDLAVLPDFLRGLHAARAPYAEQTVRHGTQTDRSILLRHEPLLQRTRAALLAAVEDYIAGLPPQQAGHPLLGRPRAPLSIAGSWSVRLGPGGFNVAHSHPQGWLSSAFYVALPPPEIMGPAPAGQLELGAPPAELGLDLPPYATIAPAPGRLVLFPSTLWHGTRPIAGGERLNIAFDIVPRPPEPITDRAR